MEVLVLIIQEAVENYEPLDPRVEFAQKDTPLNTTMPFNSTPIRNNGQTILLTALSISDP